MIQASELILNEDQSIYHLHLHPAQIAETIITVGDPNRVGQVSKYFDQIDFVLSKREFVTHTGRIGNKRLSVISTGIGPDNIDIVLNELDALFNIDFETRQAKPKLTKLAFIRIGTSGSLQENIPVDAMLTSTYGIALDNLMSFYNFPLAPSEQVLNAALKSAIPALPGQPFVFKAPGQLTRLFSDSFFKGITLTCPGFYGPQGRRLRIDSVLNGAIFEQLRSFHIEDQYVTNMEMETAAIYGLAGLLGHEAVSCNAILANRALGTFSKEPMKAVEQLIVRVLEALENH